MIDSLTHSAHIPKPRFLKTCSKASCPVRRTALLLVFSALVSVTLPVKAASSTAAEVPASSASGISIEEYRARLHMLAALLAECQGETTAARCKSAQVGPDVSVGVGGGKRQVRFGWLRALLDDAAKGAPAAGKSSTAPAILGQTLPERLSTARKRLAEDDRTAEATARNAAAAAGSTAAGFAAQRKLLAQILDSKEYNAAAKQPSLVDRLFEKVGNWIDQAIGKLAEAGSKSRWIGLVAEIGVGILVCLALVWLLIRLEREGRAGPLIIGYGAGDGAVSARDWQLWLADARVAAAHRAWRDAIHLIYWSSIARLESSGLWPADRARTPREYLALLTEASEKRTDLALLTRSFERTWYAGCDAGEADFRQAEQIAGRLGAR